MTYVGIICKKKMDFFYMFSYWHFDQFENLGIGGDGINDSRDLSTNSNHSDGIGDPTIIRGFATDAKLWATPITTVQPISLI